MDRNWNDNVIELLLDHLLPHSYIYYESYVHLPAIYIFHLRCHCFNGISQRIHPGKEVATCYCYLNEKLATLLGKKLKDYFS